MSGLDFATPWFLAGAPLALAALAVWAVRTNAARRKARAISRSGSVSPRYVSAALFAGAIAAAAIAAARPQWGENEVAAPRNSTDLVVVLDVSRSMGATDIEPSRMQAAKAALLGTFSRLTTDRVGVVIFGGNAFVRFPLTTDIEAARQVVGGLEIGTILVRPGSNVGAGLRTALEAFDLERPGGKVVLLITDGEDLGDPGEAGRAAGELRAAGVELLVAGIGTAEGAAVPVFDQRTGEFRTLTNSDGTPVISRMDESLLRLVAQAGEGRYLGADPGAIPGAVAGRVAALRGLQGEAGIRTAPIERFQWFAGAALALLALAVAAEGLPRPGRRTLLVPAGAALALLMVGCAERAHDLNEQGRDAYEQGDYATAIERFTEAQLEAPDNAQVALNLAGALHAAGRHEEALRAARRALTSASLQEQAKAQAFVGHHQFALGQYQASLDAFKQALLLDPADNASRHDYEVVLALMRQQQLEPPDGEGSGPAEGEGEAPDPGEGQAPGNEGEGEQQGPGQPQDGPGGQDGQQGGRPATLDDLNNRIAEIDREVERLQREAGGTPSPAQALEILDLLAERSRLSGMRSAFTGADDAADR
jgi:Ca-activated chloride channel family protein